MMGVEHFWKSGNTVFKFSATGNISNFQHIFAENSSTITYSGNIAKPYQAEIFKTRYMIFQECMELFHQLMLFQNLTCEIFCISIVTVIAVE